MFDKYPVRSMPSGRPPGIRAGCLCLQTPGLCLLVGLSLLLGAWGTQIWRRRQGQEFLLLPYMDLDSYAASTINRPFAIFWHGGMSNKSQYTTSILPGEEGSYTYSFHWSQHSPTKHFSCQPAADAGSNQLQPDSTSADAWVPKKFFSGLNSESHTGNRLFQC